jgi:hypothetical protein
MEEVRRGGDLARPPSLSPSRDVRLSSELDEPRLKLLGASCVSAQQKEHRCNMTALCHITERTNMELPDFYLFSSFLCLVPVERVTQLSEPHGKRAGK